MAVTINGSTGISNVNGTAAAPAESSGAGNTGLYFPTTTSAAIATNGTQAVYVDASQNVGIGTASIPSGSKLAVVGGGIQLSGGTTAQAGIRVQYASSVATISGINNDNNAYNPIAFLTSGTEAMRIDTSGNLQVGGTTVSNTAGYVNSRTNTRAWLSYNGGTQTINSSYNISSVTRNGAGDYTINMTTALATSTYAVVGLSGTAPSYSSGYLVETVDSVTARTTSLFRIYTFNTAGTNFDAGNLQLAVFGN